ncbi:MAG TPA: hypothetical protein VEW42_01560 [Candidatus Eisenbacteria bacterium]|nr:hypothetical protein [Candidatus Eisenbacteria bacterium]
MDTNGESQFSTPQPTKKPFLKGLFFLEIGLFEIGFVFLLLSGIFIALNYFNIINLNHIFPTLSILPKSKTINQPAQTLTHEEYFKNYVNSVLLTPLSSKKATAVSTTNKIVTFTWNEDAYNAQADYTYGNDQKNILITFSAYKKDSTTNIEKDDAKVRIAKLFTHSLDLGKLQCGTNPHNIFVCNLSIDNSDSRENFGLYKNAATSSAVVVFSCKLFKSNKNYSPNTKCFDFL